MKVSNQDVIKLCICCNTEYSCSYINRNSAKYCSTKCKREAFYKIKQHKIDDFVVCPICNNKYKEINTAHITTHNLTIDEFNKKFPLFNRLSISTRKNKATLLNITDEIKENLRFSHTLDSYILKYGEIDGTIKYKIRCENIANARKRENFFDETLWNVIQKSKGISLDKYILKYGTEIGTNRYKKWLDINKQKCTLPFYIKTFGEEAGLNKWFVKNKKISEHHRVIDIGSITDYNKYCMLVDKETRLSLQFNQLQNMHQRGVDFHLDHMISKCFGFNNNILPYVIGSIHNLKIIPASENLSKQRKCSISLDQLIQIINETSNNSKFFK